MTGTEEGALLGSASAVAHELRSIIAAPLMLRDVLIGVVYLDNHLVNGLFKEKDVDILLSIANHIAVAVATARSARAELRKNELEKQFELASVVQKFFLPRSPRFTHGKVDLVGFYRPAESCSGDCWWYDAAESGRVMVLTCDITGHGIAPAMVTASLTTQLRMLRRQGTPVGLMLEALNQELVAICSGDYHATMAVLDIDPAGSSVDVWSCGAPPLMLLRGAAVQVVSPRGSPLGHKDFQAGHAQVPLSPGDRLFSFTDGITELELSNGKQLGLKQLSQLVKGSAGKPVDRTVEDLVHHLDAARGQAAQLDDMTFVFVDVAA